MPLEQQILNLKYIGMTMRLLKKLGKKVGVKKCYRYTLSNKLPLINIIKVEIIKTKEGRELVGKLIENEVLSVKERRLNKNKKFCDEIRAFIESKNVDISEDCDEITQSNNIELPSNFLTDISEDCDEITPQLLLEYLELDSFICAIVANLMQLYKEKIRRYRERVKTVGKLVDNDMDERNKLKGIIEDNELSKQFPMIITNIVLRTKMTKLLNRLKDLLLELTTMPLEKVVCRTRERLIDAISNKEKGIMSITGDSRSKIRNSMCKTIFTLSKSYKPFLDSFNNMSFTGPAGVGKCLGKNTRILLYDGSIKLVQNVKSGDILMGDDSTKRNVLSITSGTEIMYKIYQSNGKSYIVNSSHILSLVSKDRTTLLDIPIKKYLKLPQEQKKLWYGYKKSVEWDIKTQPLTIDPYILGLWLGGCPDNLLVDQKHCPDNLLEKLGKYDLISKKHIPYDYMYGSSDTRSSLLKGLIGGRKRICINNSEKFLMKNIIFLAASLCINAVVSCCYGKFLKFRLFYGTDINKCRILLSNLTIKELPKNTYYGFTISGNSRFMLGDCTVTHNTKLADTMGYVFSKSGILAIGNVITTSPKDFVAGWVGQTATKATNVLIKSLENVLFIDEAYQLTSKNSGSYGMEALTELVNFLDKYCGMSITIVAGYEKFMDKYFFGSNEGLNRRFPIRYKLPIYSPKDLRNILTNNVNKRIGKIVFTPNLTNYVLKIINHMLKLYPTIFSNQAGDMINISSEIIRSYYSANKITWKTHPTTIIDNSFYSHAKNTKYI